jgi:hypothetical protein
MICHLIACAIVFGTAQQCDLSQPVESIPLPREAARTWAECRDAARDLRAVTPANFRIVRFEFFTPQTQIEEARKK